MAWPFTTFDKIGPALQRELTHIQPTAGTRLLPVVVWCKPRRITHLARSLAVDFRHESLPLLGARIRPGEVAVLRRDRSVIRVELDECYHVMPVPLSQIKAANHDIALRYKVGFLRELNGEGMRVMVQDSGCSPHRALPERQIDIVDLSGEGLVRDYHGHGTAIVSQLLARGEYPGLIPAGRVLMARIFDRQMQTSLSRILRACAIALEQRVHVVSMSYGSPHSNFMIGWAIQELHRAGICLVAAAGNSGPAKGSLEFPAAYPYVIGVAAVDKEGHLAPFSSRGTAAGPKPVLALEGVGIIMARSPDGLMGTPLGDSYVIASGTSFSCPIGAALAAMVIQRYGGKASPRQVQTILEASSHAHP